MQNKMLRLLNGTTIADKISTKSLLGNLNLLSLNQMNAQIKITEAWKTSTLPDYPLKITNVKNTDHCVTTRAVSKGDALEFGRSDLVQSTFLSDTSKAWNKTPNEINECKSVWSVKKAIKKFVTELPI